MVTARYKIGIDANRPLITEGPQSGALAPQVRTPDIIADTHTGWVRLNFVLGPWSSPGDKTLRQGHTWEQAYGEIISGFRAKGLKLYGLISSEAVKEDPGDRFRSEPGPGADVGDPWIDRYIENLVAIVRMFHRDVQVFESFNEPDDWRGSNRNWVHPGWFAVMLQRIYDAVQADPQIGQVRIVSGPLQGLEISNNGAAQYLRNTYAAGKKRFRWGEPGVPFPFQGVGYHLYFKEGHNPHWPDQERAVRETYDRYVSQMIDVIQQEERRPKPLYISEIGWHSNESDDFQERNLRLGLQLVAEDPRASLGFWFSTQDFGGKADNKWYGLYRLGDLSEKNRKPAYDAFRAVCDANLDAVLKIIYTNQQVINAFHAAGKVQDPDNPWRLLERAGLDLIALASDRQGRYVGPDIDLLPNLTDEEREMVSAALPMPAVAPLARAVRRGRPGVARAMARGVAFATGGAEVGAVEGFLRLQSDLLDIPLEPAEASKMVLASGIAFTERVAAQTWNRYGGLLAALAERLGIEPALAAAVLAIEAGGRAFSADKRMIIRFENQIFFDRWGAQHPAVFHQHFRFNPVKRWLDHAWRPAADQDWRPFHGNQGNEWLAFNFACTLNDSAAKRSISMGAPQIMGFNHAAVGYDTVQEMFDAFSTSEYSQIVGFFDFVRGATGTSRMLTALLEGDLFTFARLYNGPGQAAQYAALMQNGLEALHRLKGS